MTGLIRTRVALARVERDPGACRSDRLTAQALHAQAVLEARRGAQHRRFGAEELRDELELAAFLGAWTEGGRRD